MTIRGGKVVAMDWLGDPRRLQQIDIAILGT